MTNTIIMNGGYLKKRLKNLFPFTSKDKTRLYLNGICLEIKKGAVTLIATNGHILQKQVLFCLSVESDADISVTIPNNAVKLLISALPVKEDIVIEVDADKINFIMEEFNFSFKPIDATFPNYEKVIPQDVKMMDAEFNSTYFRKCLDAFPKNMGIKISLTDKNEPHVIKSCEADGITCVIMPMRVGF